MPYYSPIYRIKHRGGGLAGGGYLAPGAGVTCTSFCTYRMMVGAMECNPPTGICGAPECCTANPFYVKCHDAVGILPLNNIRVSYPSQELTTEIDPALPQMAITNVTACKLIIPEL